MYDSLVGMAFQDFYISIAAAVAGSGIALVPSFLVRAELDAGTLVQPVAAPMTSERVYRLILAPRKDQDPAVLALRDWLIQEAESERGIVTYS
jgi:DNA-binding transcriptional LysR family regulator